MVGGTDTRKTVALFGEALKIPLNKSVIKLKISLEELRLSFLEPVKFHDVVKTGVSFNGVANVVEIVSEISEKEFCKGLSVFKLETVIRKDYLTLNAPNV